MFIKNHVSLLQAVYFSSLSFVSYFMSFNIVRNQSSSLILQPTKVLVICRWSEIRTRFSSLRRVRQRSMKPSKEFLQSEIFRNPQGNIFNKKLDIFSDGAWFWKKSSFACCAIWNWCHRAKIKMMASSFFKGKFSGIELLIFLKNSLVRKVIFLI